MFRGLYTAVSGMQSNQRKLDITSNNMANVNTTGFKKDVLVSETFPEVLIQKMNGQLPTSTFNVNGNLNVTRDGEGYLLSTERGFFTVESPMGKSYSRELKFAVDDEGYLKTYTRTWNGNIDTTEGNYVLDANGQRVQAEGNNLNIGQNGELNGTSLVYKPVGTVIGTINSGRSFDRTHGNFTQGPLEQTGNNLDFAIDGTGFFRVAGPDGEMYTRNGSFTLNTNGQLVTSEGYPVIGQNGAITLNGNDFALREDGSVIADGQILDRLSIINVSNTDYLNKFGQSYYVPRENAAIEEVPFEGTIVQGFLEGSNVNTIDEMVNMINVMRAYESNSKVVKAYDEILQRAVNEIGKL